MKYPTRQWLKSACAVVVLVGYVSLATLNWSLDSSTPIRASRGKPQDYGAAGGYVACQHFSKTSGEVLEAHSEAVTVELCKRSCYDKSYNYAFLHGGSSCYCSYGGSKGVVLPNSKCDAPCRGDPSSRCGGGNAISVYSVRVPDGYREWTPWMRMEGSALRSRYRGCDPNLAAVSSCRAAIERNWTGQARSYEANLVDRYVGCFTMMSWHSGYKQALKHRWPVAIYECIAKCKQVLQTYAAILTSGSSRSCVCKSNLGSSLPADTCSNQYGAQVFLTNKSQNEASLSFGMPRADRKSVLLLGYFRGGTTYVASTLSHHPNTLYTYEPDSLLGVEWPGVDSFGKAAEMGVVLAESVLTRYFQCNFHMMPGIFAHWYPKWGEDNQGYESYLRCASRYNSSSEGVTKCIAVLQEACHQSSMVVAKTTRLLNPVAVERFIIDNGDVQVVHLVRDPRATLSSRKQLSSYYNRNLEHHASVLCNEIVSVDQLLQAHNESGNLLSVFYEDFALSPVKATSSMYKSLGLSMSSRVLDHLRSVTSNRAADTSQRNYAFSIRRKNSAEHVKLYRTTYDKSSIKAIDGQCSNLYSAFKAAYAADS